MGHAEKVAFFDRIADDWDGWEDLPVLTQRLSDGLGAFCMGAGETVVDVGCGTGNLTRVLLSRLSDAGRVIAADISPAMVNKAREKIQDSRVSWHVGDAATLPLPHASVDRIICFSVWPHIDDPDGTIAHFLRLLKPAGVLHVWHLISREKVNAIHAGADPAVADDVLAPAADTASLLRKHGLDVFERIDDETRYVVSARSS